MKNWLCKFGWHNWGKWSDPIFKRYTDTNDPYTLQFRLCEDCHRYNKRIL